MQRPPQFLKKKLRDAGANENLGNHSENGISHSENLRVRGFHIRGSARREDQNSLGHAQRLQWLIYRTSCVWVFCRLQRFWQESGPISIVEPVPKPFKSSTFLETPQTPNHVLLIATETPKSVEKKEKKTQKNTEFHRGNKQGNGRTAYMQKMT